jgi:hypothetical protein
MSKERTMATAQSVQSSYRNRAKRNR